MLPPETKKELQAFLGTINYLHKFSPSTADVRELLTQLTSSKTEWTLNTAYQKLFDKAKSIITEDVCMKFYDGTQPLYLETDASGIRAQSCPYYKPEIVQADQETKHQTTT